MTVVAGFDGVMHRLAPEPLRRKPFAGARVQSGQLVRVLPHELGGQEIDEQMVIAIPAAIVVERQDEQLAPLDLGDERGRIGRLCNRGADIGTKAAENHGPHQELAHRFRQGSEDFFLQVPADVAASTAERLDQIADVALAA